MSNVYRVQPDRKTIPLERVHCVSEEEELQSLLANNLSLLPGDQFGDAEELRWLLIKREMPVPSPGSAENQWSIDFLLVDQAGLPTFVECKRYNDTRARREVIGQMLEYAANGRHYWSADELHNLAQVQAGGEEELQQRLKSLVGGPVSQVEFFASVERNLRESRMRLIFFLERSSFELRSIVEFLNGQMKDTELFIVEACQYKNGDMTIVAPRVFGFTEEARKAKRESKAATVRNSVVQGEEAFWLALRQQLDDEESVMKVRDLIHSVAEMPECQISYQRTCIFAVPNVIPGRNLMTIWRTGNLELHLPSWKPRDSEKLTPVQDEARRTFLEGIAEALSMDVRDLESRSWPQFKPQIWLPRMEEVRSLIRRIAEFGKLSKLDDHGVPYVGKGEGEELSRADSHRSTAEGLLNDIAGRRAADGDGASGKEIILEVGCEGGSITLIHERGREGTWRFKVVTDESMFDDELEGGDATSSRKAETFSDAIALLDRYRWAGFYPTAIDPKYLEQVLELVRERAGSDAEVRWRKALASRGI